MIATPYRPLLRASLRYAVVAVLATVAFRVWGMP